MAITASVKKNYSQNGIELYFSGIPSDSIRMQLKEHKWRYHRGKHCWYIYYTAENMNFANRIKNRFSTDKGKYVQLKNNKKKNRKNKLGNKVYLLPESKDYKVSHVPENIRQEDINVDNIHKEREWGVYKAISPKDKRYQKKRSFFS